MSQIHHILIQKGPIEFMLKAKGIYTLALFINAV
jgi:hypothetical protein